MIKHDKDPTKPQRYPAIKLRGEVFVAPRPPNDPYTKARVKAVLPRRHVDALTSAINIIAGSDTPTAATRALIRALDNGQEIFEYGTAFADGSGFQSHGTSA